MRAMRMLLSRISRVDWSRVIKGVGIIVGLLGLIIGVVQLLNSITQLQVAVKGLQLQQEQLEQRPRIEYGVAIRREYGLNDPEVETVKSLALNSFFQAMLDFKQVHADATFEEVLSNTLPISVPIKSRPYTLLVVLTNVGGGEAASGVEVEVRSDTAISDYSVFSYKYSARELDEHFDAAYAVQNPMIGDRVSTATPTPKDGVVRFDRITAKESFLVRVRFTNLPEGVSADELVIYNPEAESATGVSNGWRNTSQLSNVVQIGSSVLALRLNSSGVPTANVVVRYDQGEPALVPSPTP